MITGGEPMLHQKEILKLIEKYNPKFVEVETNGTILALPEFIKKINLFNISPKDIKDQLKKVNVKPILLTQKNLLKDYILKFVINAKTLSEDLVFTHSFEKLYNLKKEKIYLMPLSIFDENEDKKVRNYIYQIAIQNGYNYSVRLHVVLFNKERDK